MSDMSEHPEMTPVKSSNLHSVGRTDTHLYVRFQDKYGGPGPLYRYEGKHPHHAEFLTTDSPGRHFRALGLGKGERVE